MGVYNASFKCIGMENILPAAKWYWNQCQMAPLLTDERRGPCSLG